MREKREKKHTKKKPCKLAHHVDGISSHSCSSQSIYSLSQHISRMSIIELKGKERKERERKKEHYKLRGL